VLGDVSQQKSSGYTRSGIITALTRTTEIGDDVATDVFNITTTNESGNEDGGNYSVMVHATVWSGPTNLTMNAADAGSMGYVGVFQVMNRHNGNVGRSAITEVVQTDSADNSGSPYSISAITMTLVDTSDYITTVQFTVNQAGAHYCKVTCRIELVWEGYNTAPVIAAL
jgi:hypothetical protein